MQLFLSMTATSLLEEALKLPPGERGHLCEKLWSSLNDETARTAALKAEMQRRIADTEEHPEEGVDWEDFKAEILATRGLKL
jgi:putative addiction module component (TIGR02574 family)